MKTRDRIKSTAIVLFNERGATNVSTVQIFEMMGISPGNLYYYFTNKEHIIRSIWEEDMIPQGDLMLLNTEKSNPVEVLTNMISIIMKHGLKYKFFYMEEYALFKNDPLLQQMYQKRWDFIVENLTDLFVVWQDKGYMRPSSRAWKKELAEIFLVAGPAHLRSTLSIHPEYKIKDALAKALNGMLLVVASDFVDEVCEQILAQLKG